MGKIEASRLRAALGDAYNAVTMVERLKAGGEFFMTAKEAEESLARWEEHLAAALGAVVEELPQTKAVMDYCRFIVSPEGWHGPVQVAEAVTGALQGLPLPEDAQKWLERPMTATQVLESYRAGNEAARRILACPSDPRDCPEHCSEPCEGAKGCPQAQDVTCEECKGAMA